MQQQRDDPPAVVQSMRDDGWTSPPRPGQAAGHFDRRPTSATGARGRSLRRLRSGRSRSAPSPWEEPRTLTEAERGSKDHWFEQKTDNDRRRAGRDGGRATAIRRRARCTRAGFQRGTCYSWQAPNGPAHQRWAWRAPPGTGGNTLVRVVENCTALDTVSKCRLRPSSVPALPTADRLWDPLGRSSYASPLDPSDYWYVIIFVLVVRGNLKVRLRMRRR
jgi:hypothetical protein